MGSEFFDFWFEKTQEELDCEAPVRPCVREIPRPPGPPCSPALAVSEASEICEPDFTYDMYASNLWVECRIPESQLASQALVKTDAVH